MSTVLLIGWLVLIVVSYQASVAVLKKLGLL